MTSEILHIFMPSTVVPRLSPISLLQGKLPHRTIAMVIEWAAEHQQELIDNWDLMRSDQSPHKIAPLE